MTKVKTTIKIIKETKSINLNQKCLNLITSLELLCKIQLEKKITDGGGSIGSGVSGKTTIVIAKDANENSAKLNKAREMGIEVISIADFEKKYMKS